MRNKKVSEWSKLDNAAKIFPPNSKNSDTKVFRFACELFEPVDKKVLQEALDITIEVFPLYKSIIKSGLFWYYFEKSRFKAVVTEENLPPCSNLYDKINKTYFFLAELGARLILPGKKKRTSCSCQIRKYH